MSVHQQQAPTPSDWTDHADNLHNILPLHMDPYALVAYFVRVIKTHIARAE